MIKCFNNELRFNNTQYCIKFPFREHHEILPDNFQNSKAQLVQILNKLNPDLLASSDEIIKTYQKEISLQKIEIVGKLCLVHYLSPSDCDQK